jgi:hypothetical protein
MTRTPYVPNSVSPSLYLLKLLSHFPHLSFESFSNLHPRAQNKKPEMTLKSNSSNNSNNSNKMEEEPPNKPKRLVPVQLR